MRKRQVVSPTAAVTCYPGRGALGPPLIQIEGVVGNELRTHVLELRIVQALPHGGEDFGLAARDPPQSNFVKQAVQCLRFLSAATVAVLVVTDKQILFGWSANSSHYMYCTCVYVLQHLFSAKHEGPSTAQHPRFPWEKTGGQCLPSRAVCFECAQHLSTPPHGGCRR